MRNALLIAALALHGLGVVTVFPLSDRTDPLQLSRASFDGDDPEDPAIVVEIENVTARPVPTSQIWLRASRFFTPSEMAENDIHAAYYCGRLGRASFAGRLESVAPAARVTARFSIGTDCDLDGPHTHLFIHVSSIGPGPLEQAVWYRDPPSFARLLAAAMPHP